jgi:alkanesulfonate monooxygenase SsuD/methylene tetrahydromethanopterin reductase-like flavin-dependent oxidoreductase (luciferase family)
VSGAPPTKVGLFLTNQQPPGRDMRAALEEQIELAHIARDSGWDSVWTGHHFLSTLSQLQPVPFLARLAAETGEMELGIGILLLTVENPVAVAESIASLDVICGGRMVLGAGLGYRDVEFEAFAVEKGSRVRRFEANLDIVRRLWAGEEVSADLPWCRLDGARLTTLPLQRPGPPVWIGATGDKAVARAGRLADGWLVNPAAAVEEVERQRALLTAARPPGLAPPTVAAFKEIFCAEDRATAVRLAQPYLEEKYRAYESWGQAEGLTDTDTLSVAFEELRKSRFIVGSPEDCLAELRRWRDEIGVSHFMLRTDWAGMPIETTRHSLELLAREVVPSLRGDGSRNGKPMEGQR